MSLYFVLSLIGVLAMVPIHFASVEHRRVEARFGEARGERIGSILGMVSGWGIFLFYFGLWFSPQPRFTLIPQWLSFHVSVPGLLSLDIPFLHLAMGLIVLGLGAYLGIKGVSDMGLKTAETHRATEVISEGIYSKMRHPQYLGAILSHVGVTLLLSSFYSLLVSPLVVIVNYILCWKEEKELVREFGDQYLRYQESVPMFF